MAPPAPPRAVDMRRTASRAHSHEPTTLTPSTRSRSATAKSAIEPALSIAALLTSAPTGPSSASTRANMAWTSASTETSAWIAIALRPPARISLATCSARSAERL